MDYLLLEEHIEASQAYSIYFPIILPDGFFVNSQIFCHLVGAQGPAQVLLENPHGRLPKKFWGILAGETFSTLEPGVALVDHAALLLISLGSAG